MRPLVAIAFFVCACGGTASPVDAGAPLDLAPFTTAPHPAYPVVAAQGTGAAKLVPLTIVSIVTKDDPLTDDLFAFGDAVITSDWWKIVGADYGLGDTSPSVQVIGPPMTAGVWRGANIATYIYQLIQTEQAPPPTGSTLYLLYAPAGVSLYVGGHTGCNAAGGYHDAYGKDGDGFAVIQRCSSNDGTLLDYATMVASHEIIEAASDNDGTNGFSLGPQPKSAPWNSSAWVSYEQGGSAAEVGDLCEGTVVREGKYLYQRSWSVSAAAKGGDPCVPALTTPYFNVSAPQDWYMVSAGSTIDIPITGWSSAPTDDWVVRAFLKSSSSEVLSFGIKLTSPSRVLLHGGLYTTTNNGESSTLTITAPPDAPSGSFVVVRLSSERLDDMAKVPADTDVLHPWLVGAYVP